MYKKKVFIVGNGFDLDLGYKTRYSDFYEKESPFAMRGYDSALGKELHQSLSIDKWCDIENEIQLFAKSVLVNECLSEHTVRDIQSDFKFLCASFSDYLKQEIVHHNPDGSSIAAQVLASVIENGYFKIYSFNYTNIRTISEKLKLKSPSEVYNVHGKIEDDSIILGINESTKVNKDLEFLYKTFSKHYRSFSLYYDLQEAEEVVLLGHALSSIDYSYFANFFKSLCLENKIRKDRKRVTIFTYDENSRLEILHRLRKMNDNRTELMYGLNEFQILCIKDGETEDFKKFIRDLYESSVSQDNAVSQAYQERLNKKVH